MIKSLKAERDKAVDFKNAILNGMDNGKFPEIKSSWSIEGRLETYASRADNFNRNMKLTDQIIKTGLMAIAYYIAARVLMPFVLDGVSGPMVYTSVLVVFFSYGILAYILLEAIRNLWGWYGKYIKPAAMALFAGFQVIIGMKLKKLGVFGALIEGGRLYKSGKNETLVKAADFLAKRVITEGVIFLAVTSVIGLMYLYKTNEQREADAVKNGITIPMSGGADINLTPLKVRTNLLKPIIISFIFIFIASHLMSMILKEKPNTITVFLYLVMAAVWMYMNVQFTNVKNNAVYGKRMVWLKYGFFACYAMMTLAQVPGFWIPSIVLIIVQPVAIYIIFGALSLVF